MTEEPDAGSGDCSAEAQSGECTRDHAMLSCGNGGCVVSRCLGRHVDCDLNADNGCESTLDDAENCGFCGAACRYDHAVGACDARVCKLDHCEAGFANCDGQDDNGCETSLTTVSDCGTCGKSCPKHPNAVVACEQGQCVTRCENGRADCNHTLDDGCEQKLNTTADCSACGDSCARSHASGSCNDGRCVLSRCDAGWANCNGLVEDGCEANLFAPEHCGDCSTSCSLLHVRAHACIKADNNASCAIDPACSAADPSCVASDRSNGCSAGHADCDGNPVNGCETDLYTLSNCGGCGRSCVKPNTTTDCRAGACLDTGCAPGFDTCGTAKCISLASDPQNCGQCGRACTGTAAICAGGRCTSQMCSPGEADCDGAQDNGCEVSLNEVDNCGACGLRCPDRSHALSRCTNGTCGLSGCDQGYKDCDGDPNNGCETDVNTIDNCGNCNRSCAFGNAITECLMGECHIRG